MAGVRETAESVSRITATFFVSLINRLGVRPPPQDAFLLSNVVQPVSIVDAETGIIVSNAPIIYGLPLSAGPLAAPAINTVLADTGALLAGSYDIKLWFFSYDAAVANQAELQYRDAANAASNWLQRVGNLGNGPPSGSLLELEFSLTLQASERVRVILITAAGASSVYHASLFVRAR